MKLISILSVAVIASMGLFLVGCETTRVQNGALIGGALGAGTGAIIGNQSGHAGNGALIGAGAGALAGALIGDQQEKARSQASAPPRTTTRSQDPVVTGHYETRRVRNESGETYEERVWVPDR
ncbi:MAG: glycine zipper 2TM domain-containing protein [Candidatus Hydrogenedentes bacterium]|nr:glycine zipper 2TM domain-containing protein [Candidatus Hydrogenedentota bacterium]